MSERVERALYLNEEIARKTELIEKEEKKRLYLGIELPGIYSTLEFLRQKISCLSMITREMTEDIFSRELTYGEKDLRLDKMRGQLKVLREVKDELIEEEKIFSERKEKIKEVQAPHLITGNALKTKLCELMNEYINLLRGMAEEEIPEELRSDYEYYREDSEEEDSEEEDSEEEDSEEDSEEKEPVIKTLFVHDTCCACQEKKPDIFNIPCGHVCMCAWCITKNSKRGKCAICRREVKKFYAIKSL